jgi:hypothetical protein
MRVGQDRRAAERGEMVVHPVGFEPTTQRLKAVCATIAPRVHMPDLCRFTTNRINRPACG